MPDQPTDDNFATASESDEPPPQRRLGLAAMMSLGLDEADDAPDATRVAVGDAPASRERAWSDADVAAIFRHQMSTPIACELSTLGPAASAHLRAVAGGDGLLLTSIGDLLRHPSPPLDMLRLVKDFAKTCLNHPDSGLPKEVAGTVYWAVIAAALVRRGQRITRLAAGPLTAGFQWAASRPWLDEPMAALLREAVGRAGEDKGASPSAEPPGGNPP